MSLKRSLQSAHLWLLLLAFNSLYPDKFSDIAEYHNVLDPWLTYPSLVQLQWFGYVKGEAIYDSRQVFGYRDAQLLYFPLQKLPDVNGQDINARGTFDEFAIQTRLNLAGFGPRIGCAASAFMIEIDFLGRINRTIDSTDLRQAFLTIGSPGITFLAGQAWHPFCLPLEFPDTISFNSGIPMNPFLLCPQFRMIFDNEHAELMLSAVGFLGDRPFGPTGAGAKTIRDSLMPNFNILAKIKQDEDNFVIADLDIIRVLPRLVTNNNYRERNPFTAVSADIAGHFTCKNFIWNSRFVYAENAAVFEMIGGYAVHTLNMATDERTYVPLRTLAVGTEFLWKGDWEPGIYVGYVKNIGAGTTIIPNFGPDSESGVFSLGPEIAYVFRISPRIRYYHESFILGMELEYTSAAYGTITTTGTVANAIPVANKRFLFATYYLF